MMHITMYITSLEGNYTFWTRGTFSTLSPCFIDSNWLLHNESKCSNHCVSSVILRRCASFPISNGQMDVGHMCRHAEKRLACGSNLHTMRTYTDAPTLRKLSQRVCKSYKTPRRVLQQAELITAFHSTFDLRVVSLRKYFLQTVQPLTG